MAPATRFDQWKKDETFIKISLELTRQDRKRDGRAEEPGILSIDSQSVKLAPMISEDRGLDPNKRVNRRKRQFLVDSGGRLWVIRVHAANDADGPAAIPLIDEIVQDGVEYIGERLKKVYGDQAYKGVFAGELSQWGIGFEKATRPESAQGFVPVAKPHRRTGCIVLLAYDLDTGQRYTEVSERRTKADYAGFVDRVVSTHYADKEFIDLVQDNLNTHKYGSFYEHLPLATARALSRKLVFHFTPKHGSWLNMAEPGGRSHRVLGFGPSMSASTYREPD